jgi:hypothetical protein
MHRTTGRFMQVWIFSAVRSSDGVVRFEQSGNWENIEAPVALVEPSRLLSWSHGLIPTT